MAFSAMLPDGANYFDSIAFTGAVTVFFVVVAAEVIFEGGFRIR